MKQPEVGIILVNWNGKDITLDCLESLGAITYPSYRVIIVDNGSSDGSQEAISRSFPEVTLIEAGKNLGFTGANNIGIRRALEDGVDAVLLLNNDTVVAPDFLEPMTDALFDEINVGAVNSKIYYYSEPKTIWSAGGSIDRCTGITRQNHLNERDEGQADTREDIDYGIGCALMVRRDAVEAAGLLDDAFFIYYEEAEWCQRIRSRGYRILYVPESRIWHKVSTTFSEQPERMLYYFCRNRLLFLRLTGADAQSQMRLIVTDFGRMAASFFLRRRVRQSRAIVLAVSDYCKGRFGKAPI